MDDLFSLIRKLVRVSIILLVLGVLLNDGIRVIGAFSQASKGLTAATGAALDAAQAAPNVAASGQAAATAAAAAAGTELDFYDQKVGLRGEAKHISLEVAVSARAQKTIVAAAIVGLVRGEPASEWYAPAGAKITLRQTKQLDIFG